MAMIFVQNLGYIIDDIVFRWLQECTENGERELVKDSLINFKPIISQLLIDNFNQRFPITLKRVKDEIKIRPDKNKNKREEKEW